MLPGDGGPGSHRANLYVQPGSHVLLSTFYRKRIVALQLWCIHCLGTVKAIDAVAGKT